MGIVFNGKFLTQRITGVQRFAVEILAELDKLVEKSDNIEIAVPNIEVEIPAYKNIGVVKVGCFKGNLWEQISLPMYALKKKAVLVNLCNVSPVIKPDIVCLHDVKIKARPEFFSKKFLLWYRFLFFNAAKRAKHIITVSEFSKSELIKYYGVSADRITVINNAWQHYNKVGYDENSLSKYKLDKKNYFFAMSSLEPNKNFKWIAETAKNNPDETFAIAGSLNSKVFADSLNMSDLDNVKFLGYVSDEEAKTLMRDCKAFLFPSFYEGFGIPPLEAMSAGAENIIVSDTPVMHEIFEDSVSYIDPLKYDHNLNKSANGLDNGEYINKFSWEGSAEKLNCLIGDYK